MPHYSLLIYWKLAVRILTEIRPNLPLDPAINNELIFWSGLVQLRVLLEGAGVGDDFLLELIRVALAHCPGQWKTTIARLVREHFVGLQIVNQALEGIGQLISRIL